MAAPSTTSRLVSDDAFIARQIVTALFSDTQETNAAKVDNSSLSHAVSDSPLTAIERISWNISGPGSITILQDGDSPVTALQLSGSGTLAGGGLSAEGGDLLFTTLAMAAGDTYQVDITVRKAEGFSGVPTLLSLELDTTTYATDDDIVATATFSSPVAIEGAEPELELVINDRTVKMFCLTQMNTTDTTVQFGHTVTDEDVAATGEVTFGAFIVPGTGSLAGGSPWGPAALPDVSPDLSGVSIN